MPSQRLIGPTWFLPINDDFRDSPATEAFSEAGGQVYVQVKDAENWIIEGEVLYGFGRKLDDVFCEFVKKTPKASTAAKKIGKELGYAASRLQAILDLPEAIDALTADDVFGAHYEDILRDDVKQLLLAQQLLPAAALCDDAGTVTFLCRFEGDVQPTIVAGPFPDGIVPDSDIKAALAEEPEDTLFSLTLKGGKPTLSAFKGSIIDALRVE